MVAALGRFISKSAERCLPFFNAVKGIKTTPWTQECQVAFEELKQYLSSPPLLTKPEPGEELLLYLSVSPMALAAVLIREEHNQQKPVYYVSKVLHDAEIRYQRVEKLAYALIIAARKLRPYFQVHTIKVLTDQPLRQVLHRPDTSERLVKWAVKLSKFDIQYLPRPVIKAQVLANFVAECTIHQQSIESELVQTPVVEKVTTTGERTEAETKPVRTENIPIPAAQSPSSNELIWEVYVDGSSNKVGYEAGLILTGLDNFVLDYALSKFKNFEVIIIPRTEYAKADVLSKLAASGYTTFRSIYMEFMKKSSIENEAVEIMQVEHELCWMDEIIEYLRRGKFPKAKKEARKVIQRVARLSLDGESLYKRSYTLPYLQCLRPSNAAYTLQEMHEGIYGEHLGARPWPSKYC
ncbi:uncharacterized protein LOC143888148 [Tasmannia lanceolata]|uniref:uncharacterized protein LOC143888148 n=1 Tax=Tasmannia lanceolata TaxID=3420 RepID=UPI0040645BE0